MIWLRRCARVLMKRLGELRQLRFKESPNKAGLNTSYKFP